MPDRDALGSLLDKTRDALLTGDLQALAALARETEMAGTAVSAISLAEADQLRRKAVRNEALIHAAMNGVRAARRRVADLTSQGRYSTYDAAGRRDVLGVFSDTTMRRA